MSIAPHSILFRYGKKISEDKLVDTMIYDGLIDAFNNYHMGVTAENIAKKFDISKKEQDEFALNSQKKTEDAIKNNKFDDELIKIDQGDNMLDLDEHPRKGLKISDLEKLKTVFKENGTVTPGNSSGINDGAAALILASANAIRKYNLNPLARILSFADTAHEPAWFTTAPTYAAPKALSLAKLALNDVDYFEVNEAFSVVPLVFNKILNIDTVSYTHLTLPTNREV